MLRGEQIKVLKILNGYENIYGNMFFSLNKNSRTREHEVKKEMDQCRLDTYLMRVGNRITTLPRQDVCDKAIP